VGEHRRLAGAGAAERTVDTEQVTQVEQLREGPALLADLLLADPDLDAAGQVGHLLLGGAFALDPGFAHRRLAGRVLEVEKADLAGGTVADDAPRDPDAWALPLRQIRRQSEDVADWLMAVEASAPGVNPELFDLAQLGGAAGLVFVVGA